MPTDKLLHMLAGAVIAGVALAFAGFGLAIVAVVAAGVGKEIYDYFLHGKPDAWDAIATFAGGALVLGATWTA